MVQFYALSIFVNLIAGLVLSMTPGEKKQTVFSKIMGALEDKGVKFSLGIAALIVGLFKLLTPITGDVPVVGDLLPALTGMILGGVLLLDFFNERSEIAPEFPGKWDVVLLKNKKYIGIAGILVAILHFLMPNVPIV